MSEDYAIFRNRDYTTKRTIYYKLNDNKIKKFITGEKIVILGYLPKILHDLLDETLDQNIDLYLVCPMYQDKRIQLGVTGSGKVDEEIMETLQREVMEETQINPIKFDDIKDLKSKKKIWKAANCYDWEYLGKEIKLSEDGEDHDKYKVGCLIWGDFNRLIKHPTVNLINTDKIIGLVFIPYSEVVEIKKLFE